MWESKSSSRGNHSALPLTPPARTSSQSEWVRPKSEFWRHLIYTFSHARQSERTLNRFKSRHQARLIFPFGQTIKYDNRYGCFSASDFLLRLPDVFNGVHSGVGRLDELLAAGRSWSPGAAGDGCELRFVPKMDRNTRIIRYSWPRFSKAYCPRRCRWCSYPLPRWFVRNWKMAREKWQIIRGTKLDNKRLSERSGPGNGEGKLKSVRGFYVLPFS